MGDYSKALEFYEKALEIREKALPPNHPSLVASYNNVSGVYNAMGEYSKALEFYEKALEIREKALPPNHPSLAASYNNVGGVYNAMGEYSKALEFYEKYLEMTKTALPPNHPDLGTSYNNIGGVYDDMGDYSKALEFYEKALEIREKALPRNHPDLTTSYNNIGLMYDNMGDYSKALEFYEKALEIREKALPPNHLSLAASYNNIGMAYFAMDNYSEALSFLEKALAIRQKTLPPTHPLIQTTTNYNIFYFYSIIFSLFICIMSIPLNSIDCPCLTNDCLQILIQHYSIHTTNDFALWLIKSLDKNKHLSSSIIECIQSCIIAHTANIEYRQISNRNSYKLNYLLFDNENILKDKCHLIFIYEYFNQNQWNKFFNIFLLRLFLENESIKINYINTNISLFDLNYFYYNYCCLNEKIFLQRNNLFEKFFFFNQCFHLETFENQLNFIENNQNSFQILIIDDFFSLIKPYLNLDRRIKAKILQLTYRLNRLAQKQSILIINGIILNTKKTYKKCSRKFSHHK
ncbi:unnamed protein product [Rotaria sordida]|uniref:Kinesin light chain n=2 Tax=Rotaria sordida TaxID=392033 RepID=A0A815E7U8_9BILA|nr:unnamed protein product [Rotaria sordida]